MKLTEEQIKERLKGIEADITGPLASPSEQAARSQERIEGLAKAAEALAEITKTCVEATAALERLSKSLAAAANFLL